MITGRYWFLTVYYQLFLLRTNKVMLYLALKKFHRFSGHPKVKVKYATNLSTWNGHEATTKEYERVTNLWSTQGLHWINCSGGEMCSRAVEGGHTRSGEPLYIARALTPDKNKCIGRLFYVHSLIRTFPFLQRYCTFPLRLSGCFNVHLKSQ